MPVAFGKKSKVEFDATRGPARGSADVFENPQNYTFIHNYKVHFKSSSLQMVANKLDISVSSRSHLLPPQEEVVNQFNNKTLVAMANPRMKMPSYHITNIEYKESIAMLIPENQRSFGPQLAQLAQPAAVLQIQDSQFIFCRNCANRLPADSKFCNKCGSAV